MNIKTGKVQIEESEYEYWLSFHITGKKKWTDFSVLISFTKNNCEDISSASATFPNDYLAKKFIKNFTGDDLKSLIY